VKKLLPWIMVLVLALAMIPAVASAECSYKYHDTMMDMNGYCNKCGAGCENPCISGCHATFHDHANDMLGGCPCGKGAKPEPEVCNHDEKSYVNNGTTHAVYCKKSTCGALIETVPHSYNDEGYCVCNAYKEPEETPIVPSVKPECDHDFSEKIAAIEYAAEEDGYYYYACSVCGAVGTETWAQDGSTGGGIVEEGEDPATCTHENRVQWAGNDICWDCGYNFNKSVCENLGHNFVDGACTECSEPDPDYVAPEEPKHEGCLKPATCTGEPLDNMENVLKFLELVNHEKGLGIGERHISLSTSGLVDRIYDLEKRDLQITLSISLHAPNNALRGQIMPVNRRWPVEELLAACRSYTASTHRRISYEYALIRGFNDTPECARELASLLKGQLAHVNLIRLNEIEESPLKPSTPEDTRRFCDILNQNGVTATVRRRLGFDIDASCGQLRRKFEQNRA